MQKFLTCYMVSSNKHQKRQGHLLLDTLAESFFISGAGVFSFQPGP